MYNIFNGLRENDGHFNSMFIMKGRKSFSDIGKLRKCGTNKLSFMAEEKLVLMEGMRSKRKQSTQKVKNR